MISNDVVNSRKNNAENFGEITGILLLQKCREKRDDSDRITNFSDPEQGEENRMTQRTKEIQLLPLDPLLRP